MDKICLASKRIKEKNTLIRTEESLSGSLKITQEREKKQQADVKNIERER